MISLYIHIPFCIRKCDYCSFYSINSTDEIFEEYTNALINQINSFHEYKRVKTIYFGGGTPSLIGADRLNRILEAISYKFDISQCEEITIEVNPKTSNLKDFLSLYQNGFNRLSIGLQSTNDNLLESIGRVHNYIDFLDTYNQALCAGFNNISADLMYGLPYQTLSDHIDSVNKLIEFDIKHISMYALSIEPDTKMYKFRDSYSFPDEDEEFQMYISSSEILQQNGFSHYEISNFAKEGYESKHNNGYWTGRNYLGFGTSAHSYYNNKRFSCNLDINTYIKNSKIFNDYFNFTDYLIQTPLTEKDLNDEKIMLGLRLKEGVELNENQVRKANIYINAGYMNKTNNKYHLTPSGWYISNSIIANILTE